MVEGNVRHPTCRYRSDKPWLDLRFHQNGTIVKPKELEEIMQNPSKDVVLENDLLDRIHGSLIGLTLGDSLGAHVEFRPHDFMVNNLTKTLKAGGTWGLKKGQFTDDTSMAICLASSLLTRKNFVLYDQLVRYKWWFRNGYMSSTGHCFDIGTATRKSLQIFEEHQQKFSQLHNIPLDQLDYLSDPNLLNEFDVYCSEDGVAGNGALMRLAPVPLFFYRDPVLAVEYSGQSAKITHGDQKAIDACRYYGALIVAAVRGESREDLLSSNFYRNHLNWFNGKPLHPDVENIAKGSFRKEDGYDEGIRGKGYVVDALEAALWAFWQDNESFENGALAAVNLGDDTDTTAAIYGQLAGACYGYDKLPERWRKELYAKDFLACLSEWIVYEGKQWYDNTVLITEKVNTNSECFHLTTHRNNLDKLIDFCLPAQHSPSNGKSIKIYFNNSFKSCEDVRNWIESLNEDYEEVGYTFEKHNIDGYWLLNHITDENLQKYGVQRADYRRSILNSIEDLKQNSQFKIIS